MCGIVGYLGNRSGLDVVLSGLRRLEYRGYDSAGVAVPHDGGIEWRKRAGKIVNLDAEIEANPLPESTVAIGHTRWATHGAPTDQNSHPHVAERIAIVHNGIIENHDQLRGELPGVEYRSETDSEVAAHLLRAEVESGADLTTAMRAVVARLEGAFTLVAVDALDPDRIVAARRNSPLVVGVGDGEWFLASDVAAFIAYTRDAVELGQDQIVELTRDGVTVTTFDGAPAETKAFHVDWDLEAAQKQGFDWFMRKEIFEQPHAVAENEPARLGGQVQSQHDQ